MPDILASITFLARRIQIHPERLSWQQPEHAVRRARPRALGSSVRGGARLKRELGRAATDRTGLPCTVGLWVAGFVLTDLIATLLKSTPPGREDRNLAAEAGRRASSPRSSGPTAIDRAAQLSATRGGARRSPAPLSKSNLQRSPPPPPGFSRDFGKCPRDREGGGVRVCLRDRCVRCGQSERLRARGAQDGASKRIIKVRLCIPAPRRLPCRGSRPRLTAASLCDSGVEGTPPPSLLRPALFLTTRPSRANDGRRRPAAWRSLPGHLIPKRENARYFNVMIIGPPVALRGWSVQARAVPAGGLPHGGPRCVRFPRTESRPSDVPLFSLFGLLRLPCGDPSLATTG